MFHPLKVGPRGPRSRGNLLCDVIKGRRPEVVGIALPVGRGNEGERCQHGRCVAAGSGVHLHMSPHIVLLLPPLQVLQRALPLLAVAGQLEGGAPGDGVGAGLERDGAAGRPGHAPVVCGAQSELQ